MTLRRTTIPACLLMLAIALAACAPAAPAGPTPVRMLLTFKPDVQFAPFYVAQEKGYFKANNLDVTFEHQAESDVTKQVATGQAPFGVVSGEQVLLAREQGLPVMYVFAWFQDYPIAVVSKAEENITEVKDLKGKKLGVPLKQGASYIGLEALLQSAGLSDSDVDLQVTGFNQVQTLVSGQVDAVVVYANNEPLQLDAQGVKYNIIRVGDYAALVSNGIITNEQIVKNNPGLIKAVLGAFERGLADSIKNPDEAFDASKKYVEGLSDPSVAATQRSILVETTTIWKADHLGQSNPAAWAQMQSVLLKMGLLAKELDLNAAFTNQFVPQ